MQQASFPLAPFKYSSIHTISNTKSINQTCNSSFFTDFLETLQKGLASLTFPQQSPSKISSQQKNGTTSTLKGLKGNSRHEFIPKISTQPLKDPKNRKKEGELRKLKFDLRVRMDRTA